MSGDASGGGQEKTQQTTTQQWNTDKRMVSDGTASAVNADNSTVAVNKTDFNSYSFVDASRFDNSVRFSDSSRTDNSLRYSDASDNSTRYADNSVHIMSDQGAMDVAVAALAGDRQLVQSIVTSAIDTTRNSSDNSLRSLDAALGFGEAAMRNQVDVFGAAANMVNRAMGQTETIAERATSSIQSAYANAADQVTGNRPLVIAGFIVAGIAALSMLGKGK